MASFNFSRDPPPEEMFSDIQSLDKFPDSQYEELVQIIFVFLMDPSKTEQFTSEVDSYAQQHGVDVGALKQMCKSLLLLPNNALKKNLSSQQIKEDLQNLGLSAEKASYFAEQWQTRLAGLSRSGLAQSVAVNQLLDMEWRFGVTAASSDEKTVGNTFLQLKLLVNKGSSVENVTMELTLPQFYSFLHEMEKAKSSLEFYT